MPMATPEEQRRYQREWVARRKAEWIQENGPCRHCGSWDDLEVDHVLSGTQHSDLRKWNTNSFWSWSAERRQAELAKCQVLCHACHIEKNRSEGSHPNGERVGTAKLTANAVRMIRADVAAGASKRATARKYGTSERNVRLIVARKGWAHID